MTASNVGEPRGGGRPRTRRRPRRRFPRGRRDLTVDLGLVLTAVIWGMNFPVVKAVLREVEPLAFNALRFPCAALAIWVLLRAQGRRLVPARGDWRTVIALGTAGHVVYQVCFVFGLDLTLTGNAALLLSTVPVWVLFIAVAAGWERFNPSILAGALATLAGMAILVTGGAHQTGGARIGDLLVLGAALSWSVYTVFGRRMTKRRGVLEMTAWTLWAGLPVVVAMGIPDLLRTDWAAISAGAWLGIAYAGVFAIAVAYPLWYRGVRAIGQSRTSVYQNLVPLVALAGAWLWLAEIPTRQQLFGAAVILAGVLVARRSPRR
ncbi:MAG: DMT family transporter [Gemmatimonadota bacterium]|nr:DMT family transporter [Gemmatimonadota bacterium]